MADVERFCNNLRLAEEDHGLLAKVATDNGDQDVADTILQVYVDDLAGSGDLEEEITKTKEGTDVIKRIRHKRMQHDRPHSRRSSL